MYIRNLLNLNNKIMGSDYTNPNVSDSDFDYWEDKHEDRPEEVDDDDPTLSHMILKEEWVSENGSYIFPADKPIEIKRDLYFYDTRTYGSVPDKKCWVAITKNASRYNKYSTSTGNNIYIPCHFAKGFLFENVVPEKVRELRDLLESARSLSDDVWQEEDSFWRGKQLTKTIVYDLIEKIDQRIEKFETS